MRKVFLDELPRKNKYINWKQSVGYVVRFIYNDIEGELEVLDYEPKGQKLLLGYNNNKHNIRTSDFIRCKLGRIVGCVCGDFKYDINDEFDNIIIIDKEFRARRRNYNRIEKQKWYKYHCNICNNEDWIEESNIKKGQRCNVCCSASQKVLKGYNDIATTDPWMIDLGVSVEDAETHTHSSGKRIVVKCPHCEKEKEIVISSIYNEKSIGCSCGDGVSYSEKFIISLLDQLNIQYIHDGYYIENKRYDFYLQDYRCIIETHGIQHYKQTTRKGNRVRSLTEEQRNDKYKKQLALNNGIDKYIVLDCRESNLEHIKNSIMNSELLNLFNLSKVDWLKCEEFALSNQVEKVCEYWNNKEEWETTTDLANKFNLSITTIRRYLKQGYKLGWCTDYNPDDELKKAYKFAIKSTAKPVKVFKSDKLLGIYPSVSELSRQSEEIFGVKLSSSKIGLVCNGKRNHHKGFTFKYVERSDIKCK